MYGGLKIIIRTILIIFLCVITLNLNTQQNKYILFIVHYSGNETTPTLQKDISFHTKFTDKLFEQKQILLSGKLEKNSGYFYILNTGDKSIAKNWFSGDSVIQRSSWKKDYRPFSLMQGEMCNVKNAQKENQTYTLILNNTYLTKFNIREAPYYHKEHELFIKDLYKTGNIKFWGIFDHTDGTISLMQGITDPEIFTLDPMVQRGFIVPEIKETTLLLKNICE